MRIDRTTIWVIIPTYNRPDRLEKCVMHFLNMRDYKFDFQLVIVDSSDEKNQTANIHVLQNIHSIAIKYLHFNYKFSDFYNKIAEGLSFVVGEYCCICADDDFYNKEGLLLAVEKLEQDNSLGLIKGLCANFLDGDTSKIYENSYDKFNSLLENMPLERLGALTKERISQLIYTVFRKNTLQKILQDVCEGKALGLENIRFQEYLFYFLCAVHAKILSIDRIINIRDISAKSSSRNPDDFYHTVCDGTFNDQFVKLKQVVVKALAQSTTIEPYDKEFDSLFYDFIHNSLGIPREYIKNRNGIYDLVLLVEGFHSIQKKTREYVGSAKPFDVVNIEISGICNAKCYWCATGYRNLCGKQMGKFMGYNEFVNIMEHLLVKGIIHQNTRVCLYNWGEPLIHPEFDEIVRYLSGKKIHFALSTNASRVLNSPSPEVWKTLDFITFSMPGFSQYSYDRIHKFDFETIKKNIVQILRELRSHEFHGTASIAYHLYQFNFTEIEDAKKFAQENQLFLHVSYAYINDYERLKQYLNESLPYKELKLAGEELFLGQYDLRNRQIPENYRCQQQNRLVIDEQGQVVPCCIVGEPTLGNICTFEPSLLREAKENISICTECAAAHIDYLCENPIQPSITL